VTGRIGNFCRGLAALGTLAGLTFGLPLALYKLGGSPVPTRIPSWDAITITLFHKDDGSLFFAAVRDVSWLAWLGFALAVIAETQAATRGRQAPRLPLSVLQGTAGRLVALAALTFSTPAAATLLALPALATTVQAAHRTAESPRTPARERIVVVRPGDCLWTLAQHYLGDGDQYPQIARLNLGHDMGDGEVFTDPSLILPGWHLKLPANTGDAVKIRPTADEHGRSYHDAHSSAQSRFSKPHAAAAHSAAAYSATPRSAGARHGARAGSDGESGATEGDTENDGTHRVTHVAEASGNSGATSAGRHDQVAQSALFAFGMLAGAALANLDRLRDRQRQFRRRGRRISLPADPAGRRVEQRLRAAADRWSPDCSGPNEFDDPPELAPATAWHRPEWPHRAYGEQRHLDLPGDIDGSDVLDRVAPIDQLEAIEMPTSFDEPKARDRPGGNPVPRCQARGSVGHHGLTAMLRGALRDLSDGVAAAAEGPPPIIGIHLTADTLDVLLSAPAAAPPPAPFVIAPAREAMCWTMNLGAHPGAQPSPLVPDEVGDLLPGLFTAGATEAGGYLLLDLEALQVTCCDGPSDLADRVLVTAATELASSQWSGRYELVLAGFDELDVLARAEHCRDLDRALDLLEDRARAVARRMVDGGPPDVRTRRLANPDDEDWGLTILVSRLRPTPSQMSRLLELTDGPGGMAALVAGDIQAEDGRISPAAVRLASDPDRPDQVIATIMLAYLGPNHQITVWPQTLTVAEYEVLAGVFATATDMADVGLDDAPYNEFGAAPWIRLAAAPVDPLHTPPPPIAGPRHAAPALQVKVIGELEILGPSEQLLPKQAELLLALVLHAPAGVSISGLCTLLGSDADHPRPADSIRQLITRTRKRLGQAPDGEEYIIHLGSGIYIPHGQLSLDWTNFTALAVRGRSERSRERLRTAMALVRGEPFAGCYHWWIDVGLVETIRAEIIDTAELLAQLEMAAGDPRAAAYAARAGLTAEPAAEQLWRAVMRAEYEVGNPEGVASAWTGCLDAITAIAPDGEPHPDTQQLFRQLSTRAPMSSRR
jgi:DNA-binding SARP family transcriptional activator